MANAKKNVKTVAKIELEANAKKNVEEAHGKRMSGDQQNNVRKSYRECGARNASKECHPCPHKECEDLHKE